MSVSTAATEKSVTEQAADAPVRLTVIVSSIRTDRFGPIPANWIADQARNRDGPEAVDALRGVFTEFHAVTLRDSIALANFWEVFDHDGRPVEAERLATLTDGFLGQFTWWARSLREGRTRRPYPFAESA